MPALLNARTALLLALDLPGFGLELIQRVRQLTGGRARLGMGSVYPALNRMEQEGLVRSRQVASRRRPTKYYELTASGIVARHRERAAILGLLGLPSAFPPLDPLDAR